MPAVLMPPLSGSYSKVSKGGFEKPEIEHRPTVLFRPFQSYEANDGQIAMIMICMASAPFALWIPSQNMAKIHLDAMQK